MSVYSLHFARVSALIAAERRLSRALLQEPTLLSRPYATLYRYAINLAKVGWLRTPSGEDIELADALTPFRRWLRDHLVDLLPEATHPDGRALSYFGPLVAIRTESTRQALLVRYANDFDADTLDREVGHKRLVLALGGGGGSGLAHLGVFRLIDDLGLQPSLIVGSSMGALVGLLRALRREYDPTATLLALPRKFDLGDLFRPSSGRSTFGFPGAFDMHLLPLATRTIQAVMSRRVPRFDELAIPLLVVSTGVRTGIDVDEDRLERELQKEGSSGFAVWGMRRKVLIFFKIAKQLASNARFLTQVVFGQEPGTEDMQVIDAIGFSCSVPGLLHYDLFEKDPALHKVLATIFERHGLFRLTDGGVVNNVPARVAWEAVQRGRIGTRNALVYAVDPFAPVANRNALWIPVQQLARPAVLVNRPYSDYTRTLRNVPNPINLAPSFDHLKRLTQHVRKEIAPDAAFIRQMCTPLPPYEQWSQDLHLPRQLFAEAV